MPEIQYAVVNWTSGSTTLPPVTSIGVANEKSPRPGPW